MERIARIFVIGLLIFVAACAHTFTKPTGLPADVNDRFAFHLNIEAQERGLRSSRGDTGVTVYANDGRITYGVAGDEIIATFTVPNKSGKNKNYYNQKRQALSKLSDALIDGARKRARDARDFAY